MKKRRWLIVVAAVALLVALGYVAAARPSRIERDLERIANKYGLESVHPDTPNFVGNGIPIEESRKLEAEIAQFANDYGLKDEGAWSDGKSTRRDFTALDADYRGASLTIIWNHELYVELSFYDNGRTPLQAFKDWLRNLAP